MWPQVLMLVRTVGRLWTRCCKCCSLVAQERLQGKAGAGLQLVLVAASSSHEELVCRCW